MPEGGRQHDPEREGKHAKIKENRRSKRLCDVLVVRNNCPDHDMTKENAL